VIEDAGRGIPPMADAALAQHGFSARGVGLESMRERIHQIGGRLKISSSPGKTVISALVPVND
jgi:signal transduction histidine kinase